MVLFICKNDSELFRSIGLTCHTRTIFNEILCANRCQAWLNKFDCLFDWLSTFWPLFNIRSYKIWDWKSNPIHEKAVLINNPGDREHWKTSSKSNWLGIPYCELLLIFIFVHHRQENLAKLMKLNQELFFSKFTLFDLKYLYIYFIGAS